jgi:hypothetical protein
VLSPSHATIKKVKETKALGVHIDEFLSWDKHVHIGVSRKLKSCVDHNALICPYGKFTYDFIHVKIFTYVALDST